MLSAYVHYLAVMTVLVSTVSLHRYAARKMRTMEANRKKRNQ